MRAIRRIGAVAWVTVRELGQGCAGVLLVLLAGGCLLQRWDYRAVDASEQVHLAIERGLESWLWLTVLATLVMSAWSMGEDHRTGRWSTWLTSPLSGPEYALGKVLGLALSCGCVLGIAVALALAARVMLGGVEGQFEPRVQITSRDWIVRHGDETGRPRGRLALLDRGDSVALEFDGLDEDRAQAVWIRLRGIAMSPPDEGEMIAPRLTLVDANGQVVLDQSFPALPRRGLLLPLEAQPAAGPLRARIDAGRMDGELVVEREQLRVVGSPRSLWLGVIRVALGVGACVICVAAWSVLLGSWMRDVFVLLVGLGLLGVLSLRQLLIDVAVGVAEFPPDLITDSVRRMAESAARMLPWWPNFATIAGAPQFAGAELPFSLRDPGGLGVALAWGALATLLASLSTWTGGGLVRGTR